MYWACSVLRAATAGFVVCAVAHLTESAVITSGEFEHEWRLSAIRTHQLMLDPHFLEYRDDTRCTLATIDEHAARFPVQTGAPLLCV